MPNQDPKKESCWHSLLPSLQLTLATCYIPPALLQTEIYTKTSSIAAHRQIFSGYPNRQEGPSPRKKYGTRLHGKFRSATSSLIYPRCRADGWRKQNSQVCISTNPVWAQTTSLTQSVPREEGSTGSQESLWVQSCLILSWALCPL